MDVVQQLVDGRRAYEERAWATAYQRLSALDAGALEDEDCLALGTAAYLAGDREASASGFQESYRRHIEAGSVLAAVRDTFWLGMLYNTTGNVTVGSGWAARGERLLQDADPDAVEHGYLVIHAMYGHIFAGTTRAPSSTRCGSPRRVGGARRQPRAVGLSSQGGCSSTLGQVREGLALLDEAMVGLADPDVSPILAGQSYCSMVEACQEIADYRRMADWTTTLTQWCRMQPELVPFTGQCAVHRAQIMRSRGRPARGPRGAGAGAHPVRGRGRDARSRARPLRAGRGAAGPGRPRGCGRRLSRRPRRWGATRSPACHCSGWRRETVRPPRRACTACWRRRRRWCTAPAILPAAVEVFLAVDDVDAARAAADELARVARLFGCQALEAAAAFAAGSVSLAAGDGDAGALRTRSRTCGARGSCGSTSAPGTRPRGRGCGSGWRAGPSVTRSRRRPSSGWRGGPSPRSGRSRRAAEVERLLGRDLPDGLTAREVEVLRLVASGRSNPQIAAGPLPQPEDGPAAPEQHLRQDRA